MANWTAETSGMAVAVASLVKNGVVVEREVAERGVEAREIGAEVVPKLRSLGVVVECTLRCTPLCTRHFIPHSHPPRRMVNPVQSLTKPSAVGR